MSTAAIHLIGRFGNACFQWAHAKSFCEQGGHELRTNQWAGEKVFTLDGYVPKRPDGSEEIVLSGYRQSQADLIYSRADCRRWFKLRPEAEAVLDMKLKPRPHAHLRRGDFHRCGYPTVSRESVIQAAKNFGITGPIRFVSDAEPTLRSDFPVELDFLQDFYEMMTAPVLFRANSSFSYWASVLGHGTTYSPIITGLAGGVEHDEVPYVEGNWPRLAEISFVTDLHLREE